MDKIRWGVVGTGHIANEFAKGMVCVPDAEMAAVTSRKMKTAEGFANKYGFKACYDDFENMLQTEHLDVVYIATPNDSHMQYIMSALDAGVNVLCEKPMPDNSAQLSKMIAKAKEKDLFLMEGMWTRCFPAMRKVREWLDQGKIGRVLGVHAYFGIKTMANDWQFWKATVGNAAGALRDVGIYVLAMAFLGFRESPEKIYSSHATNGEVDTHFDLMMQYSDKRVAFLTGSFDTVTEHNVVIIGEKGQIVIDEDFWRPDKAELYIQSGSVFGKELVEAFDQPFEASGFQFEITRVQECLREGLKECPDYTLDETIKICRVIDDLRKEWGIIYASDL